MNEFYMIFLILLFFILLLNIVCSYGFNPKPYHPETIFKKEFPYEGFTDVVATPTTSSTNSKPEPVAVSSSNTTAQTSTHVSNTLPTTNSTKPVEGVMNENIKPATTDTTNVFTNLYNTVFNGVNKEEVKKEGYDNILSAGSALKENNLMYLVDTTSKMCDGTSLGLSNSRGCINLSNDQIKFLQTRGGNATTKGEF